MRVLAVLALATGVASSMSAMAQPSEPIPAVRPLPSFNGSGTVDRDGRMRVQISASQQTSLSAELAANIETLPFREGDSFEEGQVLVEFDCALFRAQLSKAEAQAESAQQALRVSRRLAELNSISNLEVEQAGAKVKETEAEAGAMRVTVSKCSLNAPFSGRVAKTYVEPHEYVTQGKPLLEVVNTKQLEVKLIVPSRWLTWLARGKRFSIHVDDLNRNYTARVTRLGARIDPVSQSVSLVGEIEGSPAELLPGMSGWAIFALPK